MTTRRETLDKDIEEEIARLAKKTTMTPVKIHKAMEEKFGERAPLIRTLQRRVSELRPPGEKWEVADCDPTDARVVLDVLAAVIVRTEGLTNSFNKPTIKNILRMARLAPGLKPNALYDLEQLSSIHKAFKWDMDPIDHFLAFTPWLSSAAFEEYVTTTTKGWITPLGDLGLPLLIEIGQTLQREENTDLPSLESLIAQHKHDGIPFAPRWLNPEGLPDREPVTHNPGESA